MNVEQAATSAVAGDSRVGRASCSAVGVSGAPCKALPRYICTSKTHGKVFCGVHVARVETGFMCPECGAPARAFIRRDRERRELER